MSVSTKETCNDLSIFVYCIGHCYEKVKLETKEMKAAIKKELGLSPIEENVIVLYDGEKDLRTDEFWKVIKDICFVNM